MECLMDVQVPQNISLIIDGQALVVYLDLPSHAKTFQCFADVFVASV